MSDITIRAAVPADTGVLIAMLVIAHGEIGGLPLSIDRLTKSVQRQVDAGCVLVAVQDGRVIGSIALENGGVPYSDEPILVTVWTVVARPFRSMAAIRALARSAQSVARFNSAVLAIGVHGLNDLGRRARVFERLGFQPLGLMMAG